MIRLIVALLASVSPASAQVGELTFDRGKSLPLASGQWSYVATATGSEARFGGQLTLACDRRARTITISRTGAPATALTIITDTLSRPLSNTGRLSAQDPLLDAMTFSRGRFLVSGGSASVLAVPNWPEAARAVEDCRN